jgi:hypothetical protein
MTEHINLVRCDQRALHVHVVPDLLHGITVYGGIAPDGKVAALDGRIEP